MKFMSYALTVMAGLCFVGGLVILSNEGDVDYGATRNTFGHVR